MSTAIADIKASAEAAAELERTRDRIEELTGELEAVRRMPLPLDVALQRVKQMVAAATLPRLDLTSFMTDTAGPARADLHGAMTQSPTGTLLALAGAEIGRQVELQLRAAYGSGIKTLPGAERQQRIADLQVTIFEAEITEEKLVRQLERIGADPDRRGDANPEIVLATLED
jgi:hypothetical protein